MKDVKKVDKINKEMELFYSALGQFTTNIIRRLISDPSKVGELTKFLKSVSCPNEADRCAQFGPDYQWSEAEQACVRKPSALDLPDSGGSN